MLSSEEGGATHFYVSTLEGQKGSITAYWCLSGPLWFVNEDTNFGIHQRITFIKTMACAAPVQVGVDGGRSYGHIENSYH
jgi:hypothetical protein